MHRPPRLPTQGYCREAVVPHGQCHGAHRKRMAPGSNQMARVAAKRHSCCQHLLRKRHPPHAAIAAQLRPMQQKPTGRHPGNGRRRHSWQGRRHVKKARRNQCQRKAGNIAPAKKTYNPKPPSHCRRRIPAVRHSKTARIDMRNMPFCSLKRHVSEGSKPNAAPPAIQSVSPSSHQPWPEHRDIDANRQQKPQPNKPRCHTVRPPPVANAPRPSRENATAEAQPTWPKRHGSTIKISEQTPVRPLSGFGFTPTQPNQCHNGPAACGIHQFNHLTGCA